MVTPAGRVDVESGTYNETVVISKAVLMHGDPGDPNVTGPGPNAPVMDGSGLATKFGFDLAMGISNVTIEGFEIKKYGPDGDSDSDGIRAYNFGATPLPIDNVIIRDNYFHHLGWNGVLVWNSGKVVNSNWTIKRNKADNVYYVAYELTNATNSAIEFNDAARPVTQVRWCRRGLETGAPPSRTSRSRETTSLHSLVPPSGS